MILENTLLEKSQHWHTQLPSLLQKAKPVVNIKPDKYLVQLDLSAENKALNQLNVVNAEVIAHYIDQQLSKQGAVGGWGGYLENRLLYLRSQVFAGAEHRTLHLGVDIWMPAGETIHAVLPGSIHSFADNNNFGDYGPTIILEHAAGNTIFYSLYGHLSRASLQGLSEGQSVAAGQQIATLGVAEENGHWPPHLHFQLILDMEGRKGDFPGVAAPSHKDYYRTLCPDPNLLLGYTKDS